MIEDIFILYSVFERNEEWLKNTKNNAIILLQKLRSSKSLNGTIYTFREEKENNDTLLIP